MRLGERIFWVSLPFVLIAYFTGLVAYLKEERRAAIARRIPDPEWGATWTPRQREERFVTIVKPKERRDQ